MFSITVFKNCKVRILDGEKQECISINYMKGTKTN